MKTVFKLSSLTIIALLVLISSSVYALAEDQIDPNNALSFRKVYIDTVKDNVDGALAQIMQSALGDFFQVNARFTKSEDKDQSDTLLQLIIEKKATGFNLEGRLFIASTGEIYTHEKIKLDGNSDDIAIRENSVALLKALFGKVPFFGSVTGRDDNSVVLDVGAYQGIAEGDIVHIARVDNIKRHPLLKQIIEVQLIPVGTVRIEQTEDTVAFGKIEQEYTGESIRRLHKITGYEHPKKLAARAAADKKAKATVLDGQSPKFGMLNLGIGFNSFTHDAAAYSVTKSGSGFSPSFKLNGELWFTSNIFAELALGGSLIPYSSTNASSNEVRAGISTTTRSIGVNAGFRFMFDDTIYGPTLAFKAGYFNYRWQLPTISDDLLTARTYAGLNVEAVGSMPFGMVPYGLNVAISFLLLPSMTESSQILGTDGSSTVARFYLGGYYFIRRNLSFRGGVSFETFTTDFTAPTNGSTTQKNIGFLPSIQYFF